MSTALRLRACGLVLSKLVQHRAGSSAHVAEFVSGTRALSSAVGSSLSFYPCSSSSSLDSPWRPFSLQARWLATEADKQQPKQPSKQQEQPAFDSLELTDEKISALTDKIPQRPVGVVEGTSYGLVILAAFGVLFFFVYQFVTNFLFEPLATTCFNAAVERLKLDPRITVRLGNDISAYGSESASRIQRQQVPHAIYKDNNGVEHVRIQFHMRGPSGIALVSADMYKDSAGEWQYMYLIADVRSGNSPVQRLNIVTPSM